MTKAPQSRALMHQKRSERFPEFRELDEIARSFGAGEDLQLLRAFEAPFSRLLCGDVPKRCVDEQLSFMKNNASYNVPDATPEAFVLYRSDWVRLYVQLAVERREVADGASDLAGLANHMIVGSMGPLPLELELFHHDDPFPVDLVRPSQVLRRLGTVVLERGMQRSFVAGYEVVHIPLPQHGAAFLLLELPEIHEFRIVYDRESLRPKLLTGVNQGDEQLLYVLRIAAAAGDRSTVPLVVGALETHHAHHVRWEALQTLVSLDPDLAVNCLRKVQHEDPHPELRAAARASLPRLEAALIASRP